MFLKKLSNSPYSPSWYTEWESKCFYSFDKHAVTKAKIIWGKNKPFDTNISRKAIIKRSNPKDKLKTSDGPGVRKSY